MKNIRESADYLWGHGADREKFLKKEIGDRNHYIVTLNHLADVMGRDVSSALSPVIQKLCTEMTVLQTYLNISSVVDESTIE